jgi:hypothetical protein
MAPEMGYETKSVNDKSTLSEGWHPAFLLAITDEETPAAWKMAEQSPRMWRWHFAVWETPQTMQQTPERQSAPTSQKFSPGGKFQPSKAYVWTCELLGRQIQPGERVNLDPSLPLPCRVKVRRNNEYANIIDLEKWPEGQAYLNEGMRASLKSLMEDQAQPEPWAQPPASQPAAKPWAKPATPQPVGGSAPRF